jgi:thiosulfate dehydrogenase (quinone) large subunit
MLRTTLRSRRTESGLEAPPGVALTVTQAARACRVSPAAIQRWIDAGTFPSAASSNGTGWTVPVADLEAAGLRPRIHLYKRVAAVRIIFGVIFAIDAYLKWLPSFASSFQGQVTGAAQGQPGWLMPWFHFWAHFIALSPATFAYLTAATETLVALALLFGLARQFTYFAAAAYSLLIWAIPEGFGGPYKGGATDIGTGIIYVVLFLALYQLDTLADESPWSLDPLIERRFPRWRAVSEPSLRVKGGGTGTPAGNPAPPSGRG